MRIHLLAGVLCALCAMGVQAQTGNPNKEQMIEKLKSVPSRGWGAQNRNLTVGAAPATDKAGGPAVAAPEPVAVNKRPSVSLLIEFDYNSARVRPESQSALTNLADALQSPELKDNNFAIEGHTDAAGSYNGNLKLSQRRAAAVADILKKRGVSGQRLVTAGKGSEEPANKDDPLAAENRRVQVINLN
jgi:outer membrane protein OmpA-like peptidoglycan-associated protein